MRKVTKQSLAEIAKKMLTISENEQKWFVGRTKYYDSNGVFVCENHDGIDLIKVLQVSPGSSYTGGDEEGDSIAWSSASMEEKKNIIDTLGMIEGISKGSIDYPAGMSADVSGQVGVTYTTINGVTTVTGTSNIRINVMGPFSGRNIFTHYNLSYNDAMECILHEKFHKSDFTYLGSDRREYEALLAMQASPYFNGMDKDRRDGVTEQIAEYKRKLGL